MQGYILEERKFVELPKKEIGKKLWYFLVHICSQITFSTISGHFYSGNCYVFLCRYEFGEKRGDW